MAPLPRTLVRVLALGAHNGELVVQLGEVPI
jgi:hypothetical protein